jgi:hypothetical protein
MLSAAHTRSDQGIALLLPEDSKDTTYTIRDRSKGLNVDFMTYSMYTLAGQDPAALLNGTLFKDLAQRTFTTFFQHFVSGNLLTTSGS